MVRIPSFHPGYPGSVPGQGTKILLQDCSLLSLWDQFTSVPLQHCFSSFLVFSNCSDPPLCLYLQEASKEQGAYISSSIDHTVLWLSITLSVSLTLLWPLWVYATDLFLCTVRLSNVWHILSEQDLLSWMNLYKQTSVFKNNVNHSTVSHSVNVSFLRVRRHKYFRNAFKAAGGAIQQRSWK